MQHSLHRKVSEAKPFYASYILLLVFAAAAVVLIPEAPLGLITMAVQALAGLLLPAASMFLLLLCNDRQVLGPWVNSRWLNALASAIVGVPLVLSGTLLTTTLFPSADTAAVAVVLAAVMAAGGLAVARTLSRSAEPKPPSEQALSQGQRSRAFFRRLHGPCRPSRSCFWSSRLSSSDLSCGV